MARIRTIKPEFPQSESMGAISRDARLLFCLLWTVCDDEGRTRGASRMLASLLFPYDDDAPSLIEGWLSELESVQCIVRYSVAGSTYLQVCNWLIHQKIDKPSKSRLPAFGEGSRILAKPRETSAPDLGPRTVDLGAGKAQQAFPPEAAETDHVLTTSPVDDDGDAEAPADPPAPAAPVEPDPPADPPGDPPKPADPPAPKASIGTRLPDDWQPAAALIEWAAKEFPGVNVSRATDEFRDYWHALPGPKGRKLDWDKTWRNRIRELSSRPGSRAPPASITDRVRRSAEDFGNFDFGGGNAR